ncbi:MAG: hypothetical protein ACSLE9_00890 [Burkholderiaceae bacterium]
MSAAPARNWVTVATPNYVYVTLPDRAAFDLLDLPMRDHRTRASGRNVLTKSLEAAGVMVVFQHWLTEPAVPA